MKIFVSYASQDKLAAESIALSIRGRGYTAFLDRDDLPPGASYDEQIELAVKDSDIFVFLISPDSLMAGHYSLTELKFARQKWPTPNGRVLPVMLRKTPMEKVPTYLKAVTVLEPVGNVAAETSAAVENMQRSGFRRPMKFGMPELFSRYRYVLALGAVGGFVTLALVLFALKQPESPIHINTSGLESPNSDNHPKINIEAGSNSFSMNQSGGQTANIIINNPYPPQRAISDRQLKAFKNAVENPDDFSIYSWMFPTKMLNQDPIHIYINSNTEEAKRYGETIFELLRDSGVKALLDQTVPNTIPSFKGLRLKGTTWGNTAKIIERAFMKADIKRETQLSDYSKADNIIIVGSSPSF
jgi:TIR domain